MLTSAEPAFVKLTVCAELGDIGVARVSTLAEMLLVPCFQVLIAITAAYLIAALVRGGSAPGDVLNAAMDHTIDLAAFADALLKQ